MKKVKFNFSFSRLLGVVLAALFIFIFALYCSGRVGWFLMLVLFLAPVFSVLLTAFCYKRLTLSAEISHLLMSKGEHCYLTVALANKSFLPCPPVTVYIQDNPHLLAELSESAIIPSDKPKETLWQKLLNKKTIRPDLYRIIRLSSIPRRTVSRKVSFCAKLAGGSYIGIRHAELSDWFGICTFIVSDNEFYFRAGIIPEITSTGYDSDILACVSDAFASDNNDETVDEASLTFKGFAGYDYREYQPGDPLKRLNSKVSAKMDKLMVRLDERQAVSTVYVVLDPYMKADNAELSQATLEEALGIIFSLMSLDFSVNFYYLKEKLWIEETVFSEDALIALSQKLADHMFTPGEVAHMPDEKIMPSSSHTVLCCSDTAPDITGIHTYTVSSGEWRHI